MCASKKSEEMPREKGCEMEEVRASEDPDCGLREAEQRLRISKNQRRFRFVCRHLQLLIPELRCSTTAGLLLSSDEGIGS